uniref:Uncharacterized protein n=1 Tax=Romanomermis culicivorax TaxID=13658 RepID=A0A915K6E2_ROMCU
MVMISKAMARRAQVSAIQGGRNAPVPLIPFQYPIDGGSKQLFRNGFYIPGFQLFCNGSACDTDK